MSRLARPRVQRTAAPGMYAVGDALIVRGITPRAPWHVIDRDGDTWKRCRSFLDAVRASRAANRYPNTKDKQS